MTRMKKADFAADEDGLTPAFAKGYGSAGRF
jgi:hypothetical protein